MHVGSDPAQPPPVQVQPAEVQNDSSASCVQSFGVPEQALPPQVQPRCAQDGASVYVVHGLAVPEHEPIAFQTQCGT